MIDGTGRFLIDQLVELPSRVTEGPHVAVPAMRDAFESAVRMAGVDVSEVIGVGLDTPGPASANGVLSSRGATNFSLPPWHGFDVRTALERELGTPWDVELEPYRHAGEGAPVTLLTRVG